MNRLHEAGITPAAALDPQLSSAFAGVLTQVRHMIAGGLLWVFAGMLLSRSCRSWSPSGCPPPNPITR